METEKVAVYCRVSGDQQAKEETILTQRQETTAYCLLHNLPVYEYYLDGEGEKGVTGTLPFDRRPEGSRLLNDARAGRFKEIVVYKTARLGRDFYETVSVLRLLREQGLLVRSVTEHYDAATPDGRFMQGVHAIFAEKAREDIVQQSFDGCNRVAALGTWMGGNRPYGYQTTGTDSARRLVIDDEEAEWVRRIFAWLVEERMSCNAVARRLNALGVLTPFAKAGKTLKGVPSSGLWIAARVRSLVVNPIYKGLHPYGRKSKIREPILRAVPSIVSESVWEAAQRQLDANMKYGKRNRQREYLLSGKLRCGACGSSYVGIKQHRCEKLTYICKTRNQSGLRGCSGPHLDAAKVEAEVWGYIEGFLRNPGTAVALLGERLDERAGQADALREQVSTLVQRQETKKRERQRVIDLYASDAISREDYLLKYQRLNQEDGEMVLEEETIRQEIAVIQNAFQEIQGAEAHLRALNRRMGEAPTWEWKRDMIRLLVVVATVVVDPDGTPALDIDCLFSPPVPASDKGEQCRSSIYWGCLGVRVHCLLAA